ncbi:MAG: thiamine phosphate synthase [Propionibacteriaceae bacterium]|nr:thiamine phosphate synthase [Propionibacteriaceae bacterium]
MTALMGLDVRLKTARLYLSTDLRTETGDFADFVEKAFAGGVDILQVREDDAPEDQLLEALDLARTISYHYQGLVVVNSSPPLAKQFSGDLLHLSQADTAPKVARPMLHQWALIGQSAHDEPQIRETVADPEVNYLSIGPVYLSAPHDDYQAPGLDLVRFTATTVPPGDPESKPWFASGGIDEDTIDEVLEAGARRVWVTRAITRAADAEAAARRLSGKLRESWNADPAMQDFLASVFRMGAEADPFIPVQPKRSDDAPPPPSMQ